MTKNPSPPRPVDQSADAKGDFFFDELMTPQPDATREYLRAQIEAQRVIEARKKAAEAAQIEQDEKKSA
jgi:hypothetical protein